MVESLWQGCRMQEKLKICDDHRSSDRYLEEVFLYPDQERMSDSTSTTKWCTNRMNDTMRRNTVTNQNTAEVHKWDRLEMQQRKETSLFWVFQASEVIWKSGSFYKLAASKLNEAISKQVTSRPFLKLESRGKSNS